MGIDARSPQYHIDVNFGMDVDKQQVLVVKSSFNCNSLVAHSGFAIKLPTIFSSDLLFFVE